MDQYEEFNGQLTGEERTSGGRTSAKQPRRSDDCLGSALQWLEPDAAWSRACEDPVRNLRQSVQLEIGLMNETIMNHVQKIQNKIEEDVAALEQRRRQLNQAAELLKREKALISEEKCAWELEKRQVERVNSIDDEVVELDVGGVTEGFSVRKSLLQSVPGSSLQAMFSGRHPLKKKPGSGRVFIDRDAEPFRLLLTYLRSGLKIPQIKDDYTRELFEIELDYWQVKNSLNHELTDFQKDLQLLFDKEPAPSLVKKGGQAHQKWSKLGPFNAGHFDVTDEHEIVDVERIAPLL